MTTIICPTDFTRASYHAIRYAIGLAGKMNARIYLLHVYEIPMAYNDTAVTAFALTEPDIKGVVEKKILALRRRLQLKFPNVAIEASLRAGNTSDRIVELAGEKHADLIVMAATSGSAIEHALVGSNASRIINNSPCQLIIVPPKGAFADISNIVFATDLKEQSLKGIEKIASFAKKFRAALTLLYVNTALSDEGTEEAERMTHELKKRIRYPGISGYVCTDTDIAHGINYFVKKNSVSLLCMITHHRGFLENLWNRSVTRRVAQQLTVPLLVMR